MRRIIFVLLLAAAFLMVVPVVDTAGQQANAGMSALTTICVTGYSIDWAACCAQHPHAICCWMVRLEHEWNEFLDDIMEW